MKIVLFITLFGTVAFSSQESFTPRSSLKLVHVFFRHGARTPELQHTYPNDPYQLQTFLPMGWGQLTNEGKRQAYKLGKILRTRYDTFLGEIYTPELAYVQSTDYDRTKMTALLALAGLFPPAKSQTWNKELPWLPVPVAYEKDDQDFTLRRPNVYCPAYLEELENVLQSNEVQNFIKENKNTFDYVAANTGKPMNRVSDVFGVYQTLTAEMRMNLSLPEWSKSVYPHEITRLAIKQCQLENSNNILKRLNGGRILGKAVKHMLLKSENELHPRERKIFLYSGHENNVINILAALDLYKPHFPNYASAVILELYYLENSDEYAVKVLHLRSVNKEPVELRLQGCDIFCPFSQFLDIVEPHVPVNFTAECKSHIYLD